MIKIILQGFLIGCAKIIPGFSGSLLAIMFGVYEKVLSIFSDLKKITLKKINYLIFLSFGIIIGIILFSYLLKQLLNVNYFCIMLFFVGLIAGNIKEILSKISEDKYRVRDFFYFLIAVLFSLLITLPSAHFKINYLNVFDYFYLGIIESLTTLIPGISGTAIYIILGVYDFILSLYTNIFDITNFLNFVFFVLGFFIGTIIVSKILNFILKKYKRTLFLVILAFVLTSIYVLLKELFLVEYNKIELAIGLFFMIVGYIISNKLNHLFE